MFIMLKTVLGICAESQIPFCALCQSFVSLHVSPTVIRLVFNSFLEYKLDICTKAHFFSVFSLNLVISAKIAPEITPFSPLRERLPAQPLISLIVGEGLDPPANLTLLRRGLDPPAESQAPSSRRLRQARRSPSRPRLTFFIISKRHIDILIYLYV